MPTIDELKELESTPTPLLLFECAFRSGTVERWSTHEVTFESHDFGARLERHNLFDLRASSDEGFDGTAKLSVTLANADSRYSQMERANGFKGALLTVKFVFFDLAAGTPASEARVLFRGVGNPPDEITESALRVTFSNRLNLQRVVLPEVRIGRRCPWLFPSTPEQRLEAVDGGAKGSYSALFRCGYAPDQGGEGNLNGSIPYTSCDYTRASCTARGMFDQDDLGRTTRRFGGVEFVPAQISVRSYGEKGSHLSPVVENEARYNDVVPIVYGTAWFQPPVVFARNDGNLTHMEVLLGMGEVEGVISVIVNDIEIPEGVAGRNMTATGWFNVISQGGRNGALNPDFADGAGNPLGDPYGSMALLSVVVPNRISSGQTLAKVQVLLQGNRLEQFDSDSSSLGRVFSNNPAWVLLDVLRRSGWQASEIDLASFAAAGNYCAQLVPTTDLNGITTSVPRFQYNGVLRNRRSAAEIVKGIRAGSSLLLSYGATGLLALRVEDTLAGQQPTKPAGSNSLEALNGGWPAYEFSDGSAGFSGILSKANGEPAIRASSPNGSDTPNRLSVEFQDEFNDYQQDSLSMVEVDDAIATGREVSGSFGGLGLPNFAQAAQVLQLNLARSLRGGIYVDFETTVRGIGLTPGDLITITYLKEGWERQTFRVVRIVPGLNYQSSMITAQWHEDSWYSGSGANGAGGRRRSPEGVGIPRPLAGTAVDANGQEIFGITESLTANSEGGPAVSLEVEFSVPNSPVAAAVAIPVVNFNPQVATTGGSLHGNQTLYYALSAIDATGAEGALSFTIRAKIPPGTVTNSVTLNGVSFSSGAASFNVYRGESPAQLLRIASAVTLAGSFTDSGLTALHQTPPDENYDHANFYWRWELQPEMHVDIHGVATIGNSAQGMLPDDFKGAIVRVTRGRGAGQQRGVTTNDATTITVTPAWTIQPDATSYFTVSDGSWNFAGAASTSPIRFEVPNRPGATIEVSGRSANVDGRESAQELNPLTPWQVGGEGGIDLDTPPMPSFGLNAGSQGTVELLGIGFASLENTHTIAAGTLSLYSWRELNSPSALALASALLAADTTITVNSADALVAGARIQVGAEIMEVEQALAGGTQYLVTRGAYDSTANGHASGSPVYPLTENIVIVPFAKGFFGSPASGNYTYPIFLPDVRIGAAEFFVTNSIGRGQAAQGSFGTLADAGLRTLAGGQISLQVEGYLAVETNAVPALVIEESHSARDIFAVLREPPVGGSVELRLRQDGVEYCTMTIAAGNTTSNVVNGFGLPPLASGAKLMLDVVSVPGAPNTLPGRDLTITIRL